MVFCQQNILYQQKEIKFSERMKSMKAEEVRMGLSDGCRLAADVYLPAEDRNEPELS